jgi:hypothetical protein
MWTALDPYRRARIARHLAVAFLPCTLALLGFAELAVAQDAGSAQRMYDVELVIFRNLNAAAYSTPEIDPVPDPESALLDGLESAVEDAPAPVPEEPALAVPEEPPSLPEGYTELPEERRTLGAIEGALKRSAGYRPIAHIGWSQPAAARGASPTVSLDAALAGTGLTGTARLGVGRFLHLELELDYQTEDGRVRTITQSRRMRNGERHYLDDPQIGVIVTVNRREDSP